MQMFLAIVLVVSFLAILAPLHPKIRQACQKHFAVFHIAQAIVVAIATVSATLLFTRLIEQEEKEEILISSLERSLSNLESVAKKTDTYISRLQKYPDKYDRVGQLFNKPVCYAEISENDAFGNIKDSLFPRAAYTLLRNNEILLAHTILNDKIQTAINYIKQANEQKFFACNQRIRACLLCRPSNLLTAYMYKLNIRMVHMFISAQLEIEEGVYEENEIQPIVTKRTRALECEFLREVKHNVPAAFLPREIGISVNTLDERCS